MEKLRCFFAVALLSALIISAIPIFGAKAEETLIWEADVNSNGTPVTSPVLQSGWEYRIVAKGSFVSCDSTLGFVIFAADAQYYTLEFYGLWSVPNWWLWTSPTLASPSFLQIDGNDVTWGPFSNGGTYWWEGHEYTTYYTGTGAPITFTIMDWIDGDYAFNFCHMHVQIYETPPPPEAETAYAYGDSYATCFRNWGFKNWGWSNGPLGPGSYVFDIYAGAAKCNINKGTLVGSLAVIYDGATATVTYMMDAGWMMEKTQLYVGSEPLPTTNGDYTTSPGQYPYIHDPANPASDMFTVSGLSGDIYVVAHADVIEV